MQHRGYLQFEDQPAERRTLGSIGFEGERFNISVGETVVSDVSARDVRIETLGNGRFSIGIESSVLLFEAEDESAINTELAAHEFRLRLKAPQPISEPSPPLPDRVVRTTPIAQRLAVPAVIHPPKNPGVAAVLSFLWPGLGQIYNGQILKAMVFIIVQIVNVFLTVILIGFLTGFIVWVWSLVDAYKQAEAYNRLLAASVSR